MGCDIHVAKKLEWRTASLPDQHRELGWLGEVVLFEVEQRIYDPGLFTMYRHLPWSSEINFRSLEEAKAEAQRQLDAFVASIAEIGEK